MAKGATSKAIVMNKIRETFPKAFLANDGKELRIPMSENGEIVEIKVALTCAKTNLGGTEGSLDFTGTASATPKSSVVTSSIAAPTEEEKQTVSELCAKLGIS